VRRTSFVLAVTFVSTCFAGEPQSQPCDHDGAVACFVDRAQADLGVCVRALALPSDIAGPNNAQQRPDLVDKARQECLTGSLRELDPLYRGALAAVRYQRGTTRAVMDYFEDWKDVMADQTAPSTADSTAASTSRRADIERLNVKAERLRQGR
jgi:hypothetical protein